jgi:hypothetical protein
MIGAALICSDESCAETVEVVASFEELDHLVCDGCECTLTVLAVWEIGDRMALGSVVAMRPRQVNLRQAA